MGNRVQTILGTTVLATTLTGLAALSILPNNTYDPCGCAYGHCGCLQITLPPFNPYITLTPWVTQGPPTFGPTSTPLPTQTKIATAQPASTSTPPSTSTVAPLPSSPTPYPTFAVPTFPAWTPGPTPTLLPTISVPTTTPVVGPTRTGAVPTNVPTLTPVNTLEPIPTPTRAP